MTTITSKDALQPWASQVVAVTNADEYRAAGEYLNRLKAYRKRVEEYWADEIAAAHAQHRSLIAKRDALLAATAPDESAVKYAMLSWKQAEDRRVREEQARLDALARQAAADRALADAAALSEHADEAEAPALATIANSMIEDTYIDQEFAATRQVVRSTVPKVSGISLPKRLVVELSDKRRLILAIAAGEMLAVVATDAAGDALRAFLHAFHPVHDGLHFLDVNMPNIRREATSKGDRFALPGVIAEKREDIR